VRDAVKGTSPAGTDVDARSAKESVRMFGALDRIEPRRGAYCEGKPSICSALNTE
jgi:hypothetical protein